MKTNKVIQLLIIIILANSCIYNNLIQFNGPSIKHVYETPKGLNFKKGKWLINSIETDLPWDKKEALTQKMIKRLKKIGGDSILYIVEADLKYFNINQIKFDLSPQTLETLKQTTDFDYIINVKTQILAKYNRVGGVSPGAYSMNESEVIITVYEIDSGLKIYSQRIIASVKVEEDDDRFQITETSNSIIFNALKKGLKDIKKNAIK